MTMSSASLDPRVHKGEKILVNNMAFGIRIPFLRQYIARWGRPAIGDLVIVRGAAGGLYLREVLNVEGTRSLLNIDGWVSPDKFIAKAIPL